MHMYKIMKNVQLNLSQPKLEWCYLLGVFLEVSITTCYTSNVIISPYNDS